MYPRILALCGNPGSGKSTFQQMLLSLFDYRPVNDGGPLRTFAIQALGLDPTDVYTQEGKLRSTDILGRTWQNRLILGEFGNHLEAMFGAHIMPFMATRNLVKDQRYSFGSVRRDQGAFYKSMGGIVVGIHNPQAGPSNYEFDTFDESLVDYWILNDGLARGLEAADALDDLRNKAIDLMLTINKKKRAA